MEKAGFSYSPQRVIAARAMYTARSQEQARRDTEAPFMWFKRTGQEVGSPLITGWSCCLKISKSTDGGLPGAYTPIMTPCGRMSPSSVRRSLWPSASKGCASLGSRTSSLHQLWRHRKPQGPGLAGVVCRQSDATVQGLIPGFLVTPGRQSRRPGGDSHARLHSACVCVRTNCVRKCLPDVVTDLAGFPVPDNSGCTRS